MWGTGTPRREFLHVDDLADACVFLMKNYSDAMHINVGTGEDLSIGELAEMVKRIVHPAATIVYDSLEAGRHRRENCSMYRACTRSAGAIACRSAKASNTPTTGSWPTTPPLAEYRHSANRRPNGTSSC